jgi:hypothetical protein
VFIISYGVLRFLTDFVRINDETVFGLTGAQYMCLVLVPFGIWVLWQAFHAPAPAAVGDAAEDELADGPATEADGHAGSEPSESAGDVDDIRPAPDHEGTA